MPDSFQRLFMMGETEVLSLGGQAALGVARAPERTQLSLLVRHFLERFLNHESALPDGDAKTRLVLLAFATGLPGFMVAMYLWPIYHPFIPWPPGKPLDVSGPPFWLRVNHHFFFIVYSFVAMGIVTVFEWDLFFPDQLDIFVLTTLPILNRRLFLARVAAIALFVVGFLADANILALLALPLAVDPPNLARMLAGHALAVAGSGLFAAAFILAVQGLLLALFGERLFRRISLLLQGAFIAALLMLLFLFPVLSGAVPVLLQSGSTYASYFPPFWFLGIYQRILDGPSALPVFASLAQTGWTALSITAALAVLVYPLAYLRRVHQLVESAGTRDTRNWAARPLNRLFHATLVRLPARRAVFHFIGQTLLRVPRYRIYLVLYGGVGLSVLVASVLRVTAVQGVLRVEVSADGIRAATVIAAFWTIAGLRMAFVSPGNEHGSWVFRIIHGKPGRDQLAPAKAWVLVWGLVISLGVYAALRLFAPTELLGWGAILSQLVVTSGACILLTDVFFVSVTIIPFTGEQARASTQNGLASALLRYFTAFPVVIAIPVFCEPWMEANRLHMALAILVMTWAHLRLKAVYGKMLKERAELAEIGEVDEFLLGLGLRDG